MRLPRIFRALFPRAFPAGQRPAPLKRYRCLRSLVFFTLCPAAILSYADIGIDLAARLGADDAPILIDGVRLYDADAVRRFYTQRHYLPAWTGNGCQAAMETLLGVIQAVESHGLSPNDYHYAALVAPDCTLDRELLATDAWLALGAHLHGGRVDPITVEPNWTATRPDINLIAELERALGEGDVAGALEALSPQQSFYSALREALQRYRSYAQQGGWHGVDDGPLIRKGDSGPRVAQVRERLLINGLLEEIPDDLESVFDEVLERAVRNFQFRSNLEPDGVIGPHTLGQLNRSVEDRIAQLRANLERWRWLPEDLGRRHIRVNIADFHLEAYAHGHIEQDHRVIVGRHYRRTPSFSSHISYVVFNPWWEVPHSLALRDKLPLFQSDPDEFERLGFQALGPDGEVADPGGIDWSQLSRSYFPYRLRQSPGPLNALGQVKMMFPNAHNVYLHDTPTRGLFARVRRDFSSGCIRVESAMDLAEWVLAETPEWNRARMDAATTGATDTTALLRAPIPVHLLYLTVVATGEGGVRFIDDLYHRDPALIAALDAPP